MLQVAIYISAVFILRTFLRHSSSLQSSMDTSIQLFVQRDPAANYRRPGQLQFHCYNVSGGDSWQRSSESQQSSETTATETDVLHLNAMFSNFMCLQNPLSLKMLYGKYLKCWSIYFAWLDGVPLLLKHGWKNYFPLGSCVSCEYEILSFLWRCNRQSRSTGHCRKQTGKAKPKFEK